MGNASHGGPSQHRQGVIDADHQALRECARTQVLEVCESALCALSDVAVLVGQSSPSQSAVELERAARVQLDKALLRTLRQPCGTVSDGRAKCVVFKQLRQVFPPEDKRLHDFAIHVLAEMSDLLAQIDSQTSSGQSAAMCSCGKDAVEE